MSYLSYFIRRASQNVLVLIGLSMLIFFISRVLPGSPVRAALGRTATDQQVRELQRELGLNKPLYVQYWDWITGVVQGDWGVSLRTGNDVLSDLLARLPATIELVIVALIFAIILAIPLGVIAGTNKDRWEDHLSRVTALFGVSMPRFWVAILLQIVMVAWLGWFPLLGRLSDGVVPPPDYTGMYLVDSLLAWQPQVFLDAAWHIALPGFALGLGTLAQVTRLIRSEIIEEARSDYVLAANAYGLPQNLINYKYMLKNAFTSSLTIIGLAFGFLLGGSFLIEIVFSWPGMARYGARAILFGDMNAIVGVTLIVGFGFVTANLIVDMLYGYIDPRIQYGGN